MSTVKKSKLKPGKEVLVFHNKKLKLVTIGKVISTQFDSSCTVEDDELYKWCDQSEIITSIEDIKKMLKFYHIKIKRKK